MFLTEFLLIFAFTKLCIDRFICKILSGVVELLIEVL